MIICLPVKRANWADKGRAKASVPPPAGKGTIMFTGLAGQVLWACAHRGKVLDKAANCFRKSRRWFAWN
jgi:hypothetical protein